MTTKISFETAVTGSIKSLALVIDIQSFEGMSREDAIDYKNALGKKLTKFREEGTPVIWVAIAPGGCKLLPPTSQHAGDNNVRGANELLKMGFTGHQAGVANHDIYADFIQEFGPRENEAVYRKPTMSALATANDVNDKERLLEQGGIKLTSKRHADDHKDTKYIEPDEQKAELAKLFGAGTTLQDYLQQHGQPETHLMGAVSKYCVTETAISSALHGYKTNVLSDLVLSWKYPVNASSRDNGQLVWGDFDHQALMRQAVSNAIAARDYTQKEIQAIHAISFLSKEQPQHVPSDSIEIKRDFE